MQDRVEKKVQIHEIREEVHALKEDLKLYKMQSKQEVFELQMKAKIQNEFQRF